jgi:hypothetical protein
MLLWYILKVNSGRRKDAYLRNVCYHTRFQVINLSGCSFAFTKETQRDCVYDKFNENTLVDSKLLRGSGHVDRCAYGFTK